MKLTDDIIDQLIAEKIDNLKYTQGDTERLTGVGRNDFYKIARVSVDQGAKDPSDEKKKSLYLTDKDMEILMNNPDLITSKIESIVLGMRNNATDPEVQAKAQALINVYYDHLRDTSDERQSITQPAIRTQPSQTKGGKFPPEVESILKSVFAGSSTIEERARKLGEISKTYYGAATGDKQAITAIKSKNPRQVMSEIMLLDFFAEISKSFDAGAGGYVFEYFLALMTGGHVAGKETGPAGGMGGVDFRTANNQAGSAKWYGKGKDIHQSSGGFNKDEPVHYIIGLKKQDTEVAAGKTTSPTSGPAKLLAVDIYHMVVMKTGDDDTSSTFTIDGNPVTIPKTKDAEGKVSYGKIDLAKELKSPITRVYMARVRTETFKDMVHESIKQASGNVKLAVEALSKYIENMRLAEEESKIYATEKGTIENGNKAFKALNDAETQMGNLVTAIEPAGRTVTGMSQRQRKIKENQKLTEKILDKLIEAVILTK